MDWNSIPNCNDSVRHQMPQTDTMLKYFGEIERMVYAAEIYCKDETDEAPCHGDIPECPFRKYKCCNLVMLRAVIGDHHVPK
jgi:hypothetical protein